MTSPEESHKLLAETAYRNSQARYFDAQTRGQEIDNRTAEALAISAEIALEREHLKEKWEAASNGRHRVYHFNDAVGADEVNHAVDVLNRWDRLDPEGVPWRFVICSGGGSVIHGMKLYSTLKAFARKRPITTVASGICASMATVIHQAGTARLIEPGCSYMLHDISGELFGSISNMEDNMVWLTKLNNQLHQALAEKSNLSIEQVAELCKRRDSWLMPDQVVEDGFADAIGYAHDD